MRPQRSASSPPPPNPNANLLESLVGFWRLSDESDSSGNGRTLSNTNTTFGAGKIGDAAQFDGTAYLTTSSLPAFSGTDMSLCGWFRNTGEDTEDYIIGSGSSDLSVYVVRVEGDVKFSASESYSELLAGGSGADDGNWHFFAITRSATQKKVWLDGTYATESGDYAGMASPVPFTIGANWDGSYLKMNGEVDAVGLWDRTISDAEVAQLYNAGAGIEL